MLDSFIRMSADTWGGLPVVTLLNLAQLTLMTWVLSQRWRSSRERSGAVDARTARLLAVQRLEAWRGSVRPAVVTLMLLGPGVGLAVSTLLGALGMGALGEAMTSRADQAMLMQAMSDAYEEISYAYLLMVGGTPPMLLGPVIVLLARRFEAEAVSEGQATPEERALLLLELLLDETRRQTQLAEGEAASRAHPAWPVEVPR